MSFDPDALIDRRRLKRKLRWWQAATLVAVALTIVASLQASDLLFKRDTVARVRIAGIIVEDPRRDALLAEIAKDQSVRALIVHVDSPGGTVVGGEDLYRSLLVVGEQKPVVTVMGTVAASAAYMTAVAGDRIFAREGTITGSIGVLFQTVDITRLLDKIGVKPESLKSGPLKAVPSPTEPLTDEARAATQALVFDLFDFFIDLVVERRPLDRAQVLQLADGRVYTGRQAVANGLIDEIGGESAARDWLAVEKDIPHSVPTITLKPKSERSGLSEALSGLTGKSLFSNALTLDGLLSVWHPDL
ncbi:MAG: signal peptide peptidase SppA [Alphaproteobacteria bacterium]|nr:signal peptide peptidase SppA [Alphaproteobacteria bacterium]MCZ6591183.1 signal peptide peptidase SppA [Alphaproteobacteria bacterium]MCZ6839289.1 signal peptide peptidase SppA [Alphaproteobacteria bacterium]MCZ6845532.1 signal peptide peptidase SppA [Alphaproteobacteria bacterium]